MFFNHLKGGVPAMPFIISLRVPGSIFIDEAKEGESETALLPVPAFSLP